jgi:signal transduction histidine kinase
MVLPENQEFAPDNDSASESQEQSSLLFEEQGFLDQTSLVHQPSLLILEKSTQTSAEFLEIPVCIVAGIQANQRVKKLAVSFFEIDLEEIQILQELVNQLPQISPDRALWQEVVKHQEVVAIRDLAKKSQWAESIFVQKYGIRAFLAVPLLTANGDCLGVLMGLDLAPRQFGHKNIQFLQLTAHWIMTELERKRIRASSPQTSESQAPNSQENLSNPGSFENQRSDLSIEDKGDTGQTSLMVLEKLIGTMTQEMRNPLTSVTGMARVLNQEVYGKLNEKQKEYLNIIYDSGRYLVSLLDELVALEKLNDRTPGLEIGSVDIEMLCQQVINCLELEASRRGQELRLSVEPGDRLVLVDKSKVYQILYHLLIRLIESADSGGVVRLHVSRMTYLLKMTLWVSHPWLGEGLNPLENFELELSDPFLNEPSDEPISLSEETAIESLLSGQLDFSMTEIIQHLISGLKITNSSDSQTETIDGQSAMKLSRQDLGVLLSWELTKQHQGQIYLEGSASVGYRYLLEFPLVSEIDSIQ